MNTTRLPARPDVAQFVTQVRALLADLPHDVQQDLTEGLESDLSDQLAEGHGGALDDPGAYARELRTAAGFDPEMRVARSPRSLAPRAEQLLDSAQARWVALVDGLPGDPWSFAVSLRPVWWVLRAWVALQLVDLVWGSGSYNLGLSPVPSLLGWGWPLLAVAVLVSVQIGRGRLWPGRAGLLGRVVLLGLNTLALACVPMTVDSVLTPHDLDTWGYGWAEDEYSQGYQDAVAEQGQIHDRAGLYANGRWVSNVYPYDAQGEPLVGIQLFDQTGQPISVISQTECVYDEGGTPQDSLRVYYAWSTPIGAGDNVFPVPSRIQDDGRAQADPRAFLGQDRPSVGGFPMARVPAAQLPGLEASRTRTPKGAYDRRALLTGPFNPVERGC
ncbi:hypothetical protein [Nocardioides campestrisoli]|uniref:hypothetical protein n=1 Tax=Nocardioides campestrisoli TaxID=2736757 RepID=UPI0015E7AFEE|nr:hypothetical protein [Nocardioides campestrisoli]